MGGLCVHSSYTLNFNDFFPTVVWFFSSQLTDDWRQMIADRTCSLIHNHSLFYVEQKLADNSLKDLSYRWHIKPRTHFYHKKLKCRIRESDIACPLPVWDELTESSALLLHQVDLWALLWVTQFRLHFWSQRQTVLSDNCFHQHSAQTHVAIWSGWLFSMPDHLRVHVMLRLPPSSCTFYTLLLHSADADKVIYIKIKTNFQTLAWIGERALKRQYSVTNLKIFIRNKIWNSYFCKKI